MVLSSIMDPIMRPLLNLHPALAIAIVSILMSMMITFMYKWLTDQVLMKDLKAEMKAFQQQIKELKNNPEKAMAVQKKAMETNMKYMMHSFKPTLFTFLPIILIFGWLNASFAFYPIMPDAPFTTTATFQDGVRGDVSIVVPEALSIIGEPVVTIANSEATWTLQGPSGEYFLDYEYEGETQEMNLIISEDREYAKPLMKFKKSSFKTIKINNKAVKPFGDFSIFGWNPGWLGCYIIFSLISSLILRKALKIY